MTRTNAAIADRLRTHAAELARGRENLYRVRAFRQAAMTVLALPVPLAELIAADGPAAVAALPGIGGSLADTIAEYAAGGDWHPSRTRQRPARASDGRTSFAPAGSGAFGSGNPFAS